MTKLFVPIFIFLMISVSATRARAMIPETSRQESGTNVARNAINSAEAEFRRGQILQNKFLYGEAVICYLKSLDLLKTDKGFFNLAYCLYMNKYYRAAEYVAFRGLESTISDNDTVGQSNFLVLLGNIYSEAGNLKKSWIVYKRAIMLSEDEGLIRYAIKRIIAIENNLVFD